MNSIKTALILLASLAIVGCTPKRGPENGINPPTGNGDGQGQISEVGADELNGAQDVLGEEDVRTMDEKVADWFATNSIPEEAKLCTVYFGFDKFSVDADGRAKLDAIADKTAGNGIYIVGYTDYIGSDDYNLALSDKRAQSVKKYLNQVGGAQSAQIQAMGEQFAAKNGTREEVKEDRKVIVVDGNAAN